VLRGFVYSLQKRNCKPIDRARANGRQEIFESFEELSDDEDEEEEDEDDVDGLTRRAGDVELDDEEESGTGVLTSQLRHFVIQVRPDWKLLRTR
jgi:hypothetical protein